MKDSLLIYCGSDNSYQSNLFTINMIKGKKFALQSVRESFCLSCNTDKRLKKLQNINPKEAAGMNTIFFPEIVKAVSN